MSVQELEKLKQISNVIKQSVQTEKSISLVRMPMERQLQTAILTFASLSLVYRNTDFLKRQQTASLERKTSKDVVKICTNAFRLSRIPTKDESNSNRSHT